MRLPNAILFVVTVLAAAPRPACGCGEEVDSLFTTRVAPVLERRCFSCHNQQEHKGNFSLETREDLEASGYVVAGDPDASYLLEALTPQGGKRPLMPKESDPLSEAEVTAIRQWIAAGAAWPDGLRLEAARVTDADWWSWRPLPRPPVPPVADDGQPAWGRTPIDAFILAKLRENGLSPSPEADRRTLIRRLSFDLTGLPPTPQETVRFVHDPDPLAYEKLVDRLLESPRYGERWGRHWLDVVQYGETHGYDKDKPRPHAWPYRDYVIRAFNDDTPYARFVEEQIAGDVLWPHTLDGVTATGFLAAGPWDFIGHVEAPESKYDGKVARNLDRDNMVTSVMNTFCSLTIQCARCHHHKLDAMTMQDYYRLQAVFASLDRADRPYDADPAVAQQRGELTELKERRAAELAAIQKQIDARRTPELTQLDQTIASLEAAASAESIDRGPRSPAYGYHSAVAGRPDEPKWVQVDLGRPLPIDQVLLFGANEYGFADFGFPHRFQVAVSDEPTFANPVVLADHTTDDFPRPGASPVAADGRGAAGRFVRVTATRLWSRRVNGQPLTNDWIFALGEMAVISNGALAKVQAVTAKDTIEALPRWGRSNLTDGVYGKYELAKLAPESSGGASASDVERLLALLPPPDARTRLQAFKEQRDRLREKLIGPELGHARDQAAAALREVESQLAALPPQQTVYAGVVHKGSGNFRGRAGLEPREIFVLHRGDVNKPTERVQPGVVPLIPGQPAVFDLPSSAGEGEYRAALARWITHPDNPLTWRSIVNRVWLYHFGRGIVDTPNDFGRGGQLPTHPELLDWLAVEFRDSGQSLKALHRLICTSAVYRQASIAERGMPTAESNPQSIDSENKLLWRMNRRRLAAEEIRDAALFVAGRLDLTMGGPGFQDFVIEHPEHSPHYQYHLADPHDPRIHRRAVYRFLVRSQPQPFMNTLDCADPSMSVPKREETLTALQSLTMLNNRFMIAMAEHFAERLAREAASLGEQAALGFRLTTGRDPTDAERDDLAAYAREHGLPNACRVLLNLNEFVFVD